jgi:16S rRNA C967 or C1407 C5-methylase (RsmB/RsmF family)
VPPGVIREDEQWFTPRRDGCDGFFVARLRRTC